MDPSSPRTAHDVGLAEHELGPLVRVVGVDGHVCRAGREDSEDRDVQLGRAGGDPDADPVADADAGAGEAPPDGVDLLGQLAVGEHPAAVVHRGLVGVLRGGLREHVEQGAAGRFRGSRVERGGAGERECHRAPAGVGAVRAQRGQRAARGRMSHLPGERAVSSAGSRMGAETDGTTRGHSDLAVDVNGRFPCGLGDVREFTLAVRRLGRTGHGAVIAPSACCRTPCRAVTAVVQGAAVTDAV